MNLITTIIALLMIADASFTWANYHQLKSLISNIFPKLNIKKFAFLEGLMGGIIIMLKIYTNTLN